MKGYDPEFLATIERLHEEGLGARRIAKMLKAPLNRVDYILYQRPTKLKRTFSPSFMKDPQTLPTHCPCGKPLRVEEICMGTDPDYLLPLEWGKFDLVCIDGHRLYIDCSGLLQFDRRKEDRRKESRRIRDKKEASDVQEAKKKGDNASVSLRRKETRQVGSTLDSTAQARRREMQGTHRRSWKREATK